MSATEHYDAAGMKAEEFKKEINARVDDPELYSMVLEYGCLKFEMGVYAVDKRKEDGNE